MFRSIVFILALSLGGSTMTRAFDLSDTTEFQTGNLRSILRTTKSYGDIVTMTISAKGGVLLSDRAGALDLLVSSLGKGTPSYSKEDIDRILNETGAVFGIDAKVDSVDASLKCLKKFLPKILPLASELIRVPLLKNDEVELVRKQMMAELRAEQETPDGVMALLNHQSFFKGHPYLNRANGFLDTIAGIKRDELVELLPKIFNQSNVLFSFVGDLSQAEVSQYLIQNFASLPEGTSPALSLPEIQNETKEIAFQKLHSPATYFMARFKAPGLTNEDYPALAIASEILGNRLFEEVRTKRALTYAVSANIGMSRSNTGVLYVSSTKLPEAVKVIFDEVKKMQTVPISAADLENQVKKFISNWYLTREAPSTQSAIFAMYEIQGLGWKASNTFIERVKACTPETVRAAAEKYIRDFTVTEVGPSFIDLKDLVPGMLVAQEAPAATNAIQ